jgi:hypothetical protein
MPRPPNGSGQKPEDVAAAVALDFGYLLDKRVVL